MLDIGLVPLIDINRLPTNVAISTFAIDASTKAVCAIFVAPADISITGVSFYASKTGTSPTYRVGCYTVDTSGLPTATPVTANAFADMQVAVGTNNAYFTAPATPTAGQPFAIVIQYQSGTIDGSNNATISYGYTAVQKSPSNVVSLVAKTGTMTASSWTTSNIIRPNIAYCDGAFDGTHSFPLKWARGTTVFSAVTSNTTWNSGSTALHRGNKWVPGFSGKIGGVYVGTLDPGTNWDFKVHVRVTAPDNSSVDTNYAIDVSQLMTDPNYDSGNPSPAIGILPIDVTFNKGDTVRVYLEPTTVNNPGSFANGLIADSTANLGLASLMGYDSSFCGTTATSGLTWTDYPTANARIYPVIPMISQIDIQNAGLLDSVLIRS